jgi:hypothetical protein
VVEVFSVTIAGCAVTKKLHLGLFGVRIEPSTIAAIVSLHKPSRAQGMPAGTDEWGSAMRESLDLGMPDTAPYKEWLGVVGSIVVAALVGVILFSGGILS